MLVVRGRPFLSHFVASLRYCFACPRRLRSRRMRMRMRRQQLGDCAEKSVYVITVVVVCGMDCCWPCCRSVGLSLLRGIFESGIWRRGWRIEIPIRNTFVQRNGGICTWIGSRQCATVCPVFPLLSAHLVVGRWVGGWWSYVLCAHLLFSWWDAGKERKGKSIFEREYEGETRNEKCGKLRLY